MAKQIKHYWVYFCVSYTSMILAVASVCTLVYILPFLLTDFPYFTAPDFVLKLHDYFKTHHNLDGFLLVLAVVLPFIIAAIALTYLSRSLDAVAFGVNKKEPINPTPAERQAIISEHQDAYMNATMTPEEKEALIQETFTPLQLQQLEQAKIILKQGGEEVPEEHYLARVIWTIVFIVAAVVLIEFLIVEVIA